MKTMLFCLALAVLTSELPGAAQANPTPDTAAPKNITAPAATRMMLNGVHGGGGSFPFTPQQKALEDAKMDKINDLDQAGTLALRNRNFTAAEDDYRELLQVTATPQVAPQTTVGPAPYCGLGEALAGQGKTVEAVAAYKLGVYYPLNMGPGGAAFSRAIGNPSNLRGCCLPEDAVAWMKYALLLSQTGQNAEAFSIYSQASRFATDTAHPDVKLSFSAGQPSPVELQAAAHIALGLLVNDTGNDREQAMSEFAQARTLAPDAAVTNFYYGYGWKQLDLQSKTRLADAPQAKAALQKAVLADDPNVKKAAGEELSGLR